jgi:hypothetical protein
MEISVDDALQLFAGDVAKWSVLHNQAALALKLLFQFANDRRWTA